MLLSSHLTNKTEFILIYFKFLSKCDVIAFMKDGTVTELGTHEELVSNEKDYNHLISLDQAKRKETDDERKMKIDKNDVPTNVYDLANIQQHNKEVIGATNITEDDEINNYMEDEGEILKYSSWAVLLEYFKVSYYSINKFSSLGSKNNFKYPS